MSEDRKLYGFVPEATILENLTLVTLKQFVEGFLLNHQMRATRSKEQFDSLRVRAPGLAALVNQLSGGNQQKVVLGKWIMQSQRSSSSTSLLVVSTSAPRPRFTSLSPG